MEGKGGEWSGDVPQKEAGNLRRAECQALGADRRAVRRRLGDDPSNEGGCRVSRRLADGVAVDPPAREPARVVAVVALGANLGDRRATLDAAAAELQPTAAAPEQFFHRDR